MFERSAAPFALCFLLTAAAWAQPTPDPPFTINHKITLASTNPGGRVEMEYDLRPYRARSMHVDCFLFGGPKGSPKVAEWDFTEPSKTLRLDFRKFPSAQYFFVCHLTDERGQPVRLDFRPVQLEYGGWTGRLRVYEATQKVAASSNRPFSGMPSNGGVATPEFNFHVVPEAVAVAPGKQASLRALLNSAPMGEPLEWSLEGPGKLTVYENCFALYEADGAAAGSRAVVHVFSQQHPNLATSVQVLVSPESAGAPAP